MTTTSDRLHPVATPGPLESSGLAAQWHNLHVSTRILLVEIALIGLITGTLGAAGLPLLLGYEWHLLLHILGAVIFLGNIIITALWLTLLARTGLPALVRQAAVATQWADVAFTAPGAFLLIANGLIMVNAIGGFAAQPWAAWGLALFGASGVLWFALLIPTQEHMVRIASEAERTGTPLGPRFARALRRWTVAGIVATILPLITLGLMVIKPGIA